MTSYKTTRRFWRVISLTFIICHLSFSYAKAQSDFGMWYELGAEKKLSKNWNVSAEAEFRTRNNTRTADRWSLGLGAEYRIVKGLKASAGYIFLNDNSPEEFDMKKDGVRPNKWTPSYWSSRHRFSVSLSGSVDWGRLNISLRERWQYTYRPEAEGKKYDFDEEAWQSVKGKGKNVLRSRLQLGYDIPHWKLDPFANVEMFNDKSGIQKMRYQVGVDYKYNKKHIFALTYRFQNVNGDDDDNDVNGHLIGLSYKYKF
jgi:long-subunit fatty acid transport protein